MASAARTSPKSLLRPRKSTEAALRCRLAGGASIYPRVEEVSFCQRDTDRSLVARCLRNSEPEVGEGGIRLTQPVPGICLNPGARVLLLGFSALFESYSFESSAPRPEMEPAACMVYEPGLLPGGFDFESIGYKGPWTCHYTP